MTTLDKDISPRTAGLYIGAMLLICIAVVTFIVRSTGRTPSEAVADNTKPRVKNVSVKVTEVSGTEAISKAVTANKQKDPAKDDKEKPEVTVTEETSPYAVIAERNLFRLSKSDKGSATNGGASKGTPSPGGPPKMPGIPPMPIPSIGPMPPMGNMSVRPMGGDGGEAKKSIAFTGAVETPSGPQALLENIQTKESRFVGRNESAFGCRVCDISAQMVSLEKDGVRFTLAIGENKPDSDSGGGSKPSDQKPPEQGRPPEPGKGGPPNK
jgi:hypothetical protein